MCTKILVPTYTLFWGQILLYAGLSTHVGISNLDFKQLVGSTVVQSSCTILGPTNSSSSIIYVLCLIILSLYDSNLYLFIVPTCRSYSYFVLTLNVWCTSTSTGTAYLSVVRTPTICVDTVPVSTCGQVSTSTASAYL